MERVPLSLCKSRSTDHGPFDIIGDIHGCFVELSELLGALGYAVGAGGSVTPPEGRKALFLGNLADRGPSSPDVLRLVMRMVGEDKALCAPGNHDVKLMKKLWGRDVRVAHGPAETLAQLDGESPRFREQVATFIGGLSSYYLLDGGKLVIAHAGMREELQGRDSAKARNFALYGAPTGETDELGRPVRESWAADYRGAATVVYGHTPVAEPEWLNHTLNIDTGCVYGGRLTALRYPENELLSAPARKVYYDPGKPLG